MRIPAAAVCAAASLSFYISTALAAPETWVSGTGTDSGNCSRAAPCATFAFAQTKTNNGGTINVLTPGNFGPVDIVKSLSIVADGVEALITGALAITDEAIRVQAAASRTVSLRGLTIDAPAATYGIRFVSGAALHVQNCVIRRASFGIDVSGSAGTQELYVADAVIANFGTGRGIRIEPSGSAGTNVTLDRVNVENGGGTGILFNATVTSGVVKATVRNSVSSGNGGDGIAAVAGGASGVANVMIDRSVASNNTNDGIAAAGMGATLRIGDSTVTGNGNRGLVQGASAVFQTYETNKVNGNGTDVPVGTITPIPYR